MNNFLKILLMDCHPVVCRLSNNFALIILSQKWSSYQDNMFTCTKKALKKGGFFLSKVIQLPCVHFSVQLFRNKSRTLHKIQLTVVRFFLLNLYRFIVRLQKKNVESGTVQEKMDMMKKCKLCFLCTIIDFPMKDIFLFSPSAANVSIFSLDALVMRFEAPESRNRWDSPLFVIQVNIIVWSQVAQHYPHDKQAAKIKVWVDLHLSIKRLNAGS